MGEVDARRDIAYVTCRPFGPPSSDLLRRIIGQLQRPRFSPGVVCVCAPDSRTSQRDSCFRESSPRVLLPAIHMLRRKQISDAWHLTVPRPLGRFLGTLPLV